MSSSLPPRQVCFAAAEFAPLVQSGGLGDAVAGLAFALSERGHEVHCLLPGFATAFQHPECPPLEPAGHVHLDLPDGPLFGSWQLGRKGSVWLHFLTFSRMFEGPSLYGAADDALRFIAFSRAAAARAREIVPDVLVAHDWHAGLTLSVLRTLYDMGPGRGIGVVQTVHNGAHVGRYPASTMPATGLPDEFFQPDGIEFHGDVCLLKAGLVWADRIVAVSPSYARELQTAEFGQGLEGLYRYRSERLVGITNGIDVNRYDPRDDPALPEPFHTPLVDWRAACRERLLRELGLETAAPGRLVGAIGRLSEQKGWDVLTDAIPGLIERGGRLALLGDGDPALAARLGEQAARFPGQVAFLRGWNEAVARRIYAGADCVVVPSRFEPCGLVQLLAQRYGALPIAHAVGGLNDTIRDGETGILFAELSPAGLIDAVDRGADLWSTNSRTLSRDLAALRVSWDEPARHWERLLDEIAREGRARL